MLEIFKYEKRYHYPHMKPRDIEIWERFIAKYPDQYDTVQYDVAIGDIPAFMEERSSPQGQAMRELYKLKIDVVAYRADELHIIEVKHDAGPSSIGQLLGYVTLYKRDYEPTLRVVPVIVTNTQRPNMDFLTKEQGVTLIVV